MFKENGFTHRLVIKLLLWLENQLDPVLIKDRSVDELYLIRRILFKSRFFSIYIHRFMRSDMDTPHDHPWPFFTYIATKGYTETRMIRLGEGVGTSGGLLFPETGYRRPHSLAYRNLKTIHKVEIEGTYDLAREKEAPLTVCFIGPRLQEWGFVHWLLAKDMRWKEGGNMDIDSFPDRVVGHLWVNNRDYLNET